MRRLGGIYIAIVGLLLAVAPVHVFADSVAPIGTYTGDLEGITTIGATYTIQATITDDTDVKSVAVSVNDKVISTGDSGITFAFSQTASPTPEYAFSLKWDTTKLANGAYKIQIAASDSAGNTSFIQTATSNQNYVKFQVYNAANVVSTTVPSTTPKAKCTGSQADTDVVIGSIVTRVTSQASNLDDALNTVNSTYQKQKTKTDTADQDLRAAFAASATVNDALKAFSTIKLHCDKDPKTDLANFKTALVAIKQAMVDYRLSIQKTIEAIHV